MTTCPNGHGNPEGQRFCGECGAALVTTHGRASGKREHKPSREGVPRTAQLKLEPERTNATGLRPHDRVKVVTPGDDHEGQIGTIYALLEDDSGVCVKFSGDSEPYAFGRDELQAVPTARRRPASKPMASKATKSIPTQSAPREADKPNSGKEAAVAMGVCVLVVIGLVMSMQSVSLLTGSGLVWTGVAVVAAGTALAFVMSAPTWARVVAVLLLVVALANALYIENQMSQKRNEISQVFDK